MRLYLNKTVIITCSLLAALMIRASFWQWDRHQEKLSFIEQMHSRLDEPAAPLTELTDLPAKDLWYRRVTVEGSFLYDQEMLLRNRRYENEPGFHLITPLRLEPTGDVLLVNRGFIPMEFANDLSGAAIERPGRVELSVLLKQSMDRKFLSPPDSPTGPGKPFVRNIIRVDINHLSKQFPFPLFPYFAEIIPDDAEGSLSEQLITSKSGKDELLLMTGRALNLSAQANDKAIYPIATFNTVIPAGRHLGYVYEWAIMAIGTLLFGLVLQFRPPNHAREEELTDSDQEDPPTARNGSGESSESSVA